MLCSSFIGGDNNEKALSYVHLYCYLQLVQNKNGVSHHIFGKLEITLDKIYTACIYRNYILSLALSLLSVTICYNPLK